MPARSSAFTFIAHQNVRQVNHRLRYMRPFMQTPMMVRTLHIYTYQLRLAWPWVTMFGSIRTVRAYGDLYYAELSCVRRLLNSICVLFVCAARTHSSQSAKHWLWCHQLFYDRWFLMVIKNEIKEKLNKIMSCLVVFCVFFFKFNLLGLSCLVNYKYSLYLTYEARL